MSLAGGPVPVPAGQAQLLPVADVRAEADWILSARLSDGAIANYPDKQAVWPYLSNFAAMGLARATEVTGDAKYADASWRWLSWYQAHQDAQGFVTDYKVEGGVPVSNGFMDSTDAYAGTFLLAIRATYRVTADRTRLQELRSGITNAVRAIEATQEPDGLTWAKPDWKVKYLMDQGETYAGLLAAGELATVLGDTALAQRARDDAGRMLAGVGTTWNATVEAYDWAVHENGGRTVTDWTYLYSDALQQAWAVAFGLTDLIRGTLLLTHFHTSQPNWAKPAATALFSGGSTQLVGYWPVAGMGFSHVGSTLALGAAQSIRQGAIAANRAWPYTTGNAGQLIVYETYTATTSMIAGLPQALLEPIVQTLPTLLPTTTTAPPTTTTTTTVAPTTTTTTTTAPPTTTTTRRPAGFAVGTTANGLTVRVDLGALSAGVSLGSDGAAVNLSTTP